MAITNKYLPREPDDQEPDVFITPRFLELEFGFKPEITHKLGKFAASIVRKRWPKAFLYLHIDESDRDFTDDDSLIAFLYLTPEQWKPAPIPKADIRFSRDGDGQSYVKEATEWEIITKSVELLKESERDNVSFQIAIAKVEDYYRPELKAPMKANSKLPAKTKKPKATMGKKLK